MAAIGNVQECCGILFFASMTQYAQPDNYYTAQVTDAIGVRRYIMCGLNVSSHSLRGILAMLESGQESDKVLGGHGPEELNNQTARCFFTNVFEAS